MPTAMTSSTSRVVSSSTRWRVGSFFSTTTTAVLLLLLALLIGLTPTPCIAAGNTSHPIQLNTAVHHVTLCHFFFGAISDLGWTFTYNQGRLAIYQQLVEEFPNVTFESIAWPNVFFLPGDVLQKRAAIRDFIVTKQCTVILSNNDQLLGGASGNDYFAALYPNISFVLLGEPWLTNYAFPNRVYLANDFTGGYFVAGASAGAQSQSCIVFLAAWDSETDPTSSFAGFLLGVRRESETIPVHVIAQESWDDPISDRILTDLFVKEMGCDVVARFSDPYGVDARVADLSDPNLFSIGCHSNLQEFVGDSVLTAVYIDWTVAIMPALRSLIINGSLNQQVKYFPGFNASAIILAETSASARPGVAEAAQNAVTYLHSHPDVVCGPIRLRHGGYLAYSNGSNCKVPESNINDFITDAFTVTHPNYQSPETCPPGTFYSYAFSNYNGLLSLICTPCALDSISTVAGASSCTLCDGDSVSDDTRTACITQPLMSSGAMAGLVIGAMAFAILSLILALWQHRVHIRNSVAPRSAPLCLLFTNMEGADVLWRTEPELMKQVARQHDDIVRQVIASNHAYEVSRCGDQFVIATQSPLDGLIVAVEIQRELMATVWPSTIPRVLWPTLRGRRSGTRHPLKRFSFGDAATTELQCWNGPKVSIGLFHCRESETKVSYNWLNQRYQYRGPDPDAAALLGLIAQGGQIATTQDTLDAIMVDSHYDLILAHDAHIRLWGRECLLQPSSSSRKGAVGSSHDNAADANDNDEAQFNGLSGPAVVNVVVDPPQSPLTNSPKAVVVGGADWPAGGAPGGGGGTAVALSSRVSSGAVAVAAGGHAQLPSSPLGRHDYGQNNAPAIPPPLGHQVIEEGGSCAFESTSIYSITPVELSERTFAPCPIGLPPFRSADLALPASGVANPLSGGTTPAATNTVPGLSSYAAGGDDPYNVTTNSSALSASVSPVVLAPVTVSALILRLLQWVGPTQRRSLVRVLLDKLGKHNLEKLQGQQIPSSFETMSAGNMLAKHRLEERILRQNFPHGGGRGGGGGGESAGGADRAGRGNNVLDVVPHDPEAPQWRNPKRLAAALAVALTEAYDEASVL
ncbi:receptor-type adenylate cyclase, putative [Bodo saltans]|uniref:Receptor-type adenylate cyclase, putative n=1 Tax=Bodo saltans TaxID=75058 RepID=A0A0S4JFF9_BODSA|nr:receptor-type adenylate cyclase, putative [Bodo saltans]|eukprot:CUG88852.1 receptor-type adenylate cyclase, putative [Bodo saltans]